MGDRHIEYVPVDELVAAPKNPKTHALDQLQASMLRFQFTEPCLIDERTGRLVAGHGRVEALREAQAAGLDAPDGVQVKNGVWLVPVVRGWASTSDEEASAYVIASNRLTEVGGWNDAELADVLTDLAALPDGLVGVGYSDDDLAGFLAMVRSPDFRPASEDEQPRLDIRNPTICPNCGHQFHKG